MSLVIARPAEVPAEGHELYDLASGDDRARRIRYLTKDGEWYSDCRPEDLRTGRVLHEAFLFAR